METCMPNRTVKVLDLRRGDLVTWEVKGSPKEAFYGKWVHAVILRRRSPWSRPTSASAWISFEVLIAKAHPELSMKPGSVIFFYLKEEQSETTWKLLSRSGE